MKAWIATKNGTPRAALRLTETKSEPYAPRGDEILVRVCYATLNPADLLLLGYFSSLPFRRNATLGCDFAGEVVSVGPDVDDKYQVGAKVCGALPKTAILLGQGTLTEFIKLPVGFVAEIPANMDLKEAAGYGGIAGQTAEFMIDEGAVEPRQRILINGASGGVGSMLVQVLKDYDAFSVAICSSSNSDRIRTLGATVVVEYDKHKDLTGHIKAQFGREPFDLIFDCIGSESLYTNSPGYLSKKGTFISIAAGVSQGMAEILRYKLRPICLGGTPRQYRIITLTNNGDLARRAIARYTTGSVVNCPIDSEFDMDHVVEAYEKLASKRARGKILIKVQA